MDANETGNTLRRQLKAFAQLTTRSLGETDLDALMTDACLRARAGANVSHAKLLEYLPQEDRLLLRAGVGWQPGYVGHYSVAPDIKTPIGYAFALAEPVAIADYTTDKGFDYPSILKTHGCVASLNVPLHTDKGIFGVLEIDHVEGRSFSADDILFVTGLGNTIAQAIELRRALSNAQTALRDKQLFVQEMNHRIKNNLSLVGAMLSLHARRHTGTVHDELRSAVTRINNLALVHDRLQLFTSSTTEVNAAPHFREFAEMLRSLLRAGVTLTVECSGSIEGDCVESLTLIANELVTNAAKYAFAGRESGEIILGYRQQGAGWRLWIQDNGIGLAPDHQTRSEKSFGSQLLVTLAVRINADLATTTGAHGTLVSVSRGVQA